jgi:hypothetical protein
MTANPMFNECAIFSETLVGVKSQTLQTKLDTPIYLGFTVLELSKLFMYKFHYLKFRPEFPSARCIYTDTDSLVYDIPQDSDIFEDMKKNADWYDTSNFPRSHFLYSAANKKKAGTFKDELGGQPFHEFVGLKPKLYAVRYGDDEKRVAKGIARSTVEHDISFQDYLGQLDDHTEAHWVTTRGIRSFKHDLKTVECERRGLSGFDDKRFLCSDGITTRAHGNFRNNNTQLKRITANCDGPSVIRKRQSTIPENFFTPSTPSFQPSKRMRSTEYSNDGNTFDQFLRRIDLDNQATTSVPDPGFYQNERYGIDDGLEDEAVWPKRLPPHPYLITEAVQVSFCPPLR